MSVDETLRGDRPQWEKFLHDNREQINEVTDQHGTILLVSAVVRLRFKYQSIDDNAQFEVFFSCL